MTPQTKTPKPFEMIAGHPALDLINTLDNRFADAGLEELLNSYDDLLRFCHQAQLLSGRQRQKLRKLHHLESTENPCATLAQTIDLRENLATAAYALADRHPIPAGTLANLESIFQQAANHRRLTAQPTQLAWEFKGISRDLNSPLWLLAQSAAELFSPPNSDQPLIAQLQTCACPTCRWLFLDTSKNHSRRWCDMRICGNRNKARRYQSRQSTT